MADFPAAPVPRLGTVTPTSITWEWDAITGATGYQFQTAQDREHLRTREHHGETSSTSRTLTVQPGESWWFRVRAEIHRDDRWEHSGWSGPLKATSSS